MIREFSHMKTTPSVLSVLLLSAFSAQSYASECGEITIADMN
jgi:glycine betaine/proline transport system substrate-binding protein